MVSQAADLASLGSLAAIRDPVNEQRETHGFPP